MRKISLEKQQEIIKLYVEQRMSTVQVSFRTGVSSTCVTNVIKRHGIIPRNVSQSKLGVKRGSILPVSKIIELYKSGLSSTKVATELDISKASVIRILKDENVDRDNSYSPKNKYGHLYDSIIASYQSGLSLLEVSKMYGVSYTRTQKVLKKHGCIRSHMRGKSQLGKPIPEEQKSKVRNTRSTRKESGLYDHMYLKRTGHTYEEFQKRRPEFKKYHQKVRSFTNQQPLHTLENYDKRGKAGKDGAYHIDHKYSIIAGFKNGIDPAIIGHITNLHMIPFEINMVKQGDCWITLEELLRLQTK